MTDDPRPPAESDGLARARPLAERRPASRALDRGAARVGTQAWAGSGRGRGPLAPERVLEIRRKIMAGVYRSPWVLEQVARRLVECGQLQPVP